MFSRLTKGRLGLVIIVFLTSFPFILWIVMRPLGVRFGNSFFALTSIGQISALLGITLFAITFILSARLKFLEDYFGGLDRIYNIHHISGTIAFVFLLVHPLVLAVKLIPFSVLESAKFLIPGGDWAINFGIFSILLMMLLLVITFFAKWRYQYLRFAHQILGAAFFLGALHAFFIPSDISQNMILRVYILGLSGLAITAYLYRTIFGKYLVKKFTYVVESVNDLGQNITEIVMRPEGKTMYYTPGQFLFVSFKDGGISDEIHPFSISSAPTENVVRITVKALGDFTSELKKLNIGAIAKIEGPFGGFSYLKSNNKKQIWIAGGIGITPFLNMIRNLKINKRDDLNIDFYYATKTADEMIFRNEIEKITEKNPNLRFIPHISEEQGRLDIDVIKKISCGITEKDIFICGPRPMMSSLIDQFLSSNIPKSVIHTEEFKLL